MNRSTTLKVTAALLLTKWQSKELKLYKEWQLQMIWTYRLTSASSSIYYTILYYTIPSHPQPPPTHPYLGPDLDWGYSPPPTKTPPPRKVPGSSGSIMGWRSRVHPAPPPQERTWDQWKYHGMEVLWDGDGGTPLPRVWTDRQTDRDRQTRVKTLLRTRAVKIKIQEMTNALIEFSDTLNKNTGKTYIWMYFFRTIPCFGSIDTWHGV